MTIITFMKNTKTPIDVNCLESVSRAAALLHPLRMEVLRAADEPRSASEIAQLLGETRQKVNYHVRTLEREGFLRRAGRKKKRNLFEQKYIVVAKSFVLSPQLLGSLAVDQTEFEDSFSAATLLALAQRMSREVGRSIEDARLQEKRLATLSISTELRFKSAAQRERFTIAMRDAMAAVVAEHANPMETSADKPAKGRPYRLVLGCHPIPPSQSTTPKNPSP